MLSLRISPYSRHGRPFTSILHLSTTATSPPPLLDFLITTCGFSTTESAKILTSLPNLKTLEKPTLFISFMESHGFSLPQIKNIVSSYPCILTSNAAKTLAPKFQSLHRDLNFTPSQITDLVASNPVILSANFQRKTLPKIRFWETLLGSRDHLMKIVNDKFVKFFSFSIEERVIPNLELLRGFGISDKKTALIVRKSPNLILQRPERFLEMVRRAEEDLKVPRDSGMFLWTLLAVYKAPKARLDAKMALMGEFGWSKDEFLVAFSKAPLFIMFSDEMLRRKMEFLVKEMGCLPTEVAHYPILLALSLDRRLIPRHRVMRELKRSGLVKREYKLSTIMNYSPKVFEQKYVVPYKDEVKGLQEMYAAGMAGGCAREEGTDDC